MQADFTPGPPELGPKGFGGIHPIGRSVDPFWDFDLPDKIVAMIGQLLEHPATRPYLERYGLAYRSNQRGVLLSCTRCEKSPCTCGDLADRCNHYMVAIYRDQSLRPIFDQHGLAVRGG